jgi:acid phosphatase type 7
VTLATRSVVVAVLAAAVLPLAAATPAIAAAVPAGSVPVSGDWNGDGATQPGWFHDGRFYLAVHDDGPLISFRYGRLGDRPVAGDWNGSGVDGVGVFRDGQWYLRNDLSSGPSWRHLRYGRAGDQPVAGDWNRTGRDGIGVFRSGYWYVRNRLSDGPSWRHFRYGRAGDRAVTGDWQRLGRDGVGVVREGTWYLRSHLEEGPSTYHYPYGRARDLPVTGDWNGDGRTTSGVVRREEWRLTDHVPARSPITIRTHAEVPTSAPRVAVTGDMACDPLDRDFNGGAGTATRCRQRAVSDLVVAGGYGTLITTGDNQYQDGRSSAFEASYGPSYGRVLAITRPVPGNHEYWIAGAKGYFDYFGARAGTRGEGWYSFDVGDWHVVALNSNCAHIGGCHTGSPQEQWLRADLAERRPACTIATLHHPRWSSGRHGGSSEVAPLYRALADAEADVVVAGHDHDYERFASQDVAGAADDRGLRQFVVGTGGKDIRPFATIQPNSERRIGEHGVLEMSLRADSYDWRFLNVDGAVLDGGTAHCVR